MQYISKEDGNIVLLQKGEIGNKLRRLIQYMGLSAHHEAILKLQSMLFSIEDSDCLWHPLSLM